MNGQSAVSDAEAAGSDAFADRAVVLHWEASRALSLWEHQESRREEYGPSTLSETPSPTPSPQRQCKLSTPQTGAISRKKRRWRKKSKGDNVILELTMLPEKR